MESLLLFQRHALWMGAKQTRFSWESPTGMGLSPSIFGTRANLRWQNSCSFNSRGIRNIIVDQAVLIKRVVVDLTQHPRTICLMKYAAIFVAMSRVTDKNHIRLLEKDTILPRSTLYEYLPSVSPDSNIAPFLHGYSDDGLPWNPSRALSYSRK